MMMFSIWGSWSDPAAWFGLGSSPGWRTAVGTRGVEVVVVAEDAFDDEPQAPSPAAAAPTSAPPIRVRREKAGVGLMTAP
jgi:hypothetical protein